MSTQEQSPAEKPSSSGWSIQVAKVAGIPVRVHFTFIFLIAYMAYMGQQTTGNWAMWVVFALLLFVCVVLHELGHALTAKAFGIKTRDITLYPIGGVAMFEGRMKPAQELWIALAGPAVNLVIAALICGYFVFLKGGMPWPSDSMMGNGLLYALFGANLVLAIFNMIPAFPMDGGRVLRAALGLMIGENKATVIAGAVGQVMAVVLGIWAIAGGNPLMLFIAILVFVGAGQEMSASSTRSFLEGRLVREAMQVRFRTIPHGATLQAAAEMLLAGSQHDFPVMGGDEIAGILTRVDIARGLASEGPSAYVAGYMNREVRRVAPGMMLEEAVEMFSTDGVPLLVIEGEQLVGMLTQENLSEFIMLQHALKQRRQPG